MSTFQLSRSALEWSQSFSLDERESMEFTFDDILPVAGTHRKQLLHAIANVKPASMRSENVNIRSLEDDCDLDSTSEMQKKLMSLTASKNDTLVQLKQIEAQISDIYDKRKEENLRADQFCSLLDEQCNISQFVGSFIAKLNSYCQSPPVAGSLKMMIGKTMSAVASVDIEMHENKLNQTLSAAQDHISSNQDAVIDEFLATLGDIETIIAEGDKDTSSETTIIDDTCTTSQLLQRLARSKAEKKSLLECIRMEETEAVIRRRKASNSGVSHSKGEMDDLLRTADKFREDISLQARRNLSMEAQVETDVQDIRERLTVDREDVSSFSSAVLDLQQKCENLAEAWKVRTEMMRYLPAWRLHTVRDNVGVMSDVGMGCNRDNTTEKGEADLVESSFGIEHLIAGGDTCDQVCYRDSVKKRSQDYRSQFRAITSSAGVPNGLTLEDSFHSLSSVQHYGSPSSVSPHREGNKESSFLDQLVHELRGLSEQIQEMGSMWSGNGKVSDAPPVSSLKSALSGRKSVLDGVEEANCILGEDQKLLTASMEALSWALRDRYDSYTAAPCLVEALKGYTRPRQSCNCRDIDKNRSGCGNCCCSDSGDINSCRGIVGNMYNSPNDCESSEVQFQGQRLSSMTLLEVINFFRESSGVNSLE